MRLGMKSRSISTLSAIVFASLYLLISPAGPSAADPPVPLLSSGNGGAVDWWFVFKFNATSFPGCGGKATRECIFGGEVQDYSRFSQQFLYASSKRPALKKGNGCLGDSVRDPVGATFDQVFNGQYFYIIWNDQFYLDPRLQGCGNSCPAPWAHSKGMLAWDESGAGFVMQVSTPNWPGAGNQSAPRQHNGNTLGCLTQIKKKQTIPQNNVLYSQHFFALQLTKEALKDVLRGLENASVLTDPSKLQIVKNGGPQDVQDLVNNLGETSDSKAVKKFDLKNGVTLISKPSALNVPPWQMVSAVLDGVSLRVASWWSKNRIYTTTPSTRITCWDPEQLGDVRDLGTVEIATTGQTVDGDVLGLKGGQNHAKIARSTTRNTTYSIFGDMNQEGALLKSQDCTLSQNGRGGLFFVLEDEIFFESMKTLLKGATAGTSPGADDEEDTPSDDQ
jgi:Deoxyribonuclease II